MPQNWIVVGDTTTGGGSVVAGSPFTDVDGRAVARVNDPVVCGRHGQTSIVSGDATMIIDGQPVARHGDYCACGCKLLSVRQKSVFIDTGPAVGSAAASPAAFIPKPARAAETAAQFNSGNTAGDPQKARDVIRDANAALQDAGDYRPYETELEAARAWRERVLPVADDHGVEVGALISRGDDGMYYLGGAFSTGSYDNVRGLVENAPHTAGDITANIHTHPHSGGWVGRDRGFMAGQRPELYKDDSGRIHLIGGENLGGDLGGDLVLGYYYRLNTYIADADGLHGWTYSEYISLQEADRIRAVRLGEVYRSY